MKVTNGEELRAAREQLNMTRSELASKIGISKAVLDKLETGSRGGWAKTWDTINEGLKEIMENKDSIWDRLNKDIAKYGRTRKAYLYFKRNVRNNFDLIDYSLERIADERRYIKCTLADVYRLLNSDKL